MIKKANIQWTVNTLCKQIEKGALLFDNYVQRSLVWDKDVDRKSLLIHSLIEGYPVPAFYFAKYEKGYSAIDGKQRSNTIYSFKNDEYALSDNTPNVFNDNEKEEVICGKKFSELPEWMKENINGYSLTIYYFEDITQDEINELFYRLNNGKPLKAIELMRVKTRSMEAFRTIADHDAISSAVSIAGKKGYNDELIAMQIWAILYTDNPSFMTKDLRETIGEAEVTTSQMSNINRCLDMVSMLYKEFCPEDKEDKKILKRLKARTHLVSLVYMANRSENTEEFIKKATKFFSGSKTSISEEYNNAAGRASAKPESIKSRLNAIDDILFADKSVVTQSSNDSSGVIINM